MAIMAKRSNSHKDVEFEVGGASFKTFNEAAAYAVSVALYDGSSTIDIVVHSETGARWLSGPDGLMQYHDDPDQSVFERIVVKVNSLGPVA